MPNYKHLDTNYLIDKYINKEAEYWKGKNNEEIECSLPQARLNRMVTEEVLQVVEGFICRLERILNETPKK